MRDIRAIVFDTFGTLVDWRTSLIDELTAFGAARDVAADWTGLVDAWRAAYAPSMDRVRRGELPWTKLDALHRTSLDALVVQFGITGLTEADLHHINLGWHRLKPWPDVVAGLHRLHECHILGPLSNGNVALLIDLARHAGLPFDMVFSAEVFGHYKPDAEVYLGACRLLSLEPHQVMLCAAHNNDLAAARSHGLSTAFVARPTEYGPHQKVDFEADGPWDFVVKDLGELADQL
jgi:2-haloacid dehalogenase